jgi:hypothetical protein
MKHNRSSRMRAMPSSRLPGALSIVHEVDHAAMKKDFWDTLNGRSTPLPSKRQN